MGDSVRFGRIVCTAHPLAVVAALFFRHHFGLARAVVEAELHEVALLECVRRVDRGAVAGGVGVAALEWLLRISGRQTAAETVEPGAGLLGETIPASFKAIDKGV